MKNKYKYLWFYDEKEHIFTVDTLEEIIEEIISFHKDSDIENLVIKNNGETIDITYFDSYEDSDKEFSTKATPKDVANFLYEYCCDYGEDDEFAIKENN